MKKTMKSLHCWDSITLDIVATLLEKITEQDAKTNSIQNPVKNPCAIGCFLNNSGAKHMRTSYQRKWFCAALFHCGHLHFTWKTHCGLIFRFG